MVLKTEHKLTKVLGARFFARRPEAAGDGRFPPHPAPPLKAGRRGGDLGA